MAGKGGTTPEGKQRTRRIQVWLELTSDQLSRLERFGRGLSEMEGRRRGGLSRAATRMHNLAEEYLMSPEYQSRLGSNRRMTEKEATEAGLSIIHRPGDVGDED